MENTKSVFTEMLEQNANRVQFTSNSKIQYKKLVIIALNQRKRNIRNQYQIPKQSKVQPNKILTTHNPLNEKTIMTKVDVVFQG